MLAAAVPLIPVLCAAMAQFWADMPMPGSLGAQIEQESRWNPRAELKTAREYGVGLGQLTITPAFNNFDTIKRQQPALRDWAWADRYQPRPQMIALLTMDRSGYESCGPLMGSARDALACAFSSYNGGFGGFKSDRRVCANTSGCDPRVWFGNVALTSLKAKTVVKGYGQSFYQINRMYVQRLLIDWPGRYQQALSCGKGS